MVDPAARRSRRPVPRAGTVLVAILAVAAIADGHAQLLVFGLALAIILMAFAATMIMKLLTRYPAISWLGLFVLLYVAAEMFYRGIFDPATGILVHLSKGGIA